MTYFFCFDILSLYLEQNTALPFSNKVESILQFSLKVTFVSSQDTCQFTHNKIIISKVQFFAIST